MKTCKMPFSARFMRQLAILLLLGAGITGPNRASAQAFTATPTYREMVFPANEFVFYAYMDLVNLTGSDLEMVWKKSFPTPFPAAWDNAIVDPDSFYTNNEFRGEFTLSANPPFPEKIICQFFPNNTVGNASVMIRIFLKNDSTQFLDLEWVASTTPVGLAELHDFDSLKIYPVPAADQLNMDNLPDGVSEIQLVGMDGKMMRRWDIIGKKKVSLNIEGLPGGVYGIKILEEEKLRWSGTVLK